MARNKRQRIEERLQLIEERLSNAEAYVVRNVNVEGSSWLHFGDWRGKSGHPSWMKNHMIPTMMKLCKRNTKVLEALDSKAKDKRLANRRQQDECGPALTFQEDTP